MLYDHYAMYDSDYHRKEFWKYPSFATRLAVFAQKKWSIILHHMLLLGFGYALVVVSMMLYIQPACLCNNSFFFGSVQELEMVEETLS